MASQGTTPGKRRNERSCIVCGVKTRKLNLLRIVRSPDGSVSFDQGGKAPGRGAYVCSAECFEAASKGGKLSRALKAQVGEEELGKVSRQIAEYDTRHRARQ